MGSMCSGGTEDNGRSGISLSGKKVKVCNELISRVLINE